MEKEPRDRWSKVDISAKALAALLLPVVIFYFTYQQQKSSELRLQQEKLNEERRLEQQRTLDLAQRNADRVTTYLNHLASNNPNERKLSLQVLSFFARNNQFPEELLTAVISATGDKDPAVASASSTTLAQVARSNPETAKAIVRASESNVGTARDLSEAVNQNPDLAGALKTVEPNLRIPVAALDLTSNPSGAAVFLVPAAFETIESRYRKVGTTPVRIWAAEANYVCIFDLNGKRTSRRVSLRAGDIDKLHVEF